LPESDVQGEIKGLLDFLVASIPSTQMAIPLTEEIGEFKKLSPEEQEKGLGNLYAFAENYILTNLKGNYINQQNLQKSIREKFPLLFKNTSLRLIEKYPEEQGFLITKAFIGSYAAKAHRILGLASQGIFEKALQWLDRIPAFARWHGFPEDYPEKDPKSSGEWIELLAWVIEKLEQVVDDHMGYKMGHEVIEKAYNEVGRWYRNLEGFSYLVNAIPKQHLDKEKVSILNNSQMQNMLLDKLHEFERLNQELQQKNKALAKAYDFNQMILDTVGEGIITINADNLIIRANGEAAKLFGYEDVKELIDTPLFEIMPSKYRDKHKNALAQRKENPDAPSSIMGKWIEMEGLKKDGTIFPMEINITKTYSEADQLIFTAALKDITGQKAYQDSLQQENVALEKKVEERTKSLKASNMELTRSNQELEHFAYVTSHDLREPLRTIISFIQLIDKKYSDHVDEQGQEYISFVVEGAKRMNSLIDDLLLYSRVGRAAIEIREVDLAEVIETVKKNLYSSIQQKHAEITFGQLEPIGGDSKLLEQLFQNLIDNAIKFCKRKPQIEVSTHQEESYTSVHIKDNGIGIDSRFKERIFEIFNRLHHVRDFPGTGIGLAVCKKIMDKHKGEIDLVSEKGEGTTFILKFPKGGPTKSSQEEPDKVDSSSTL
jgi:PAS domain S-box-containing protein